MLAKLTRCYNEERPWATCRRGNSTVAVRREGSRNGGSNFPKRGIAAGTRTLNCVSRLYPWRVGRLFPPTETDPVLCRLR